MQPEQQPLDTREKAVDLAAASLNEYSSIVKLVLGLSAGAVMLFINVLASQHVPRAVSWLFVASVLLFGATAILCILVLLMLAGFRMLFAQGLADQSPNWRQDLTTRVDGWQKAATKLNKWLALLFGLGFLLAGASVIVLVWLR